MTHQTAEDGNISLSALEQFFTDSEDESRDARESSEKSRDYYDNIQLTEGEVNTLNKRNQPTVVFNRVAPKIDFLLGTERQTRTDPKAFPRTPDHEEAADAVTDSLRYVLDNEDFDMKASNVFEDMLIEGSGGCSVEVEIRGDDIEIAIKRFRWDRFFADPYSLMRDYVDATYMGVIVWKDLHVAQARWPHAADDLEAGLSLQTTNETYDDKPVRWFNKERRRVMCVDIYYLWKAKWHHAIFAKGVWLEPPTVSPYVDSDGMPVNPLIAASAKVKRDGQRYGVVEALRDIQDEINKRRSKSLHLLTTKQTFAKEGQITDINKFKSEANKSDGHMEFPNNGEFGKDFGVVQNEGLAAPQFSMYQDAMLQMDTQAANAALSGKIDGELSGKAIRSLQQGGLAELTPLFDTHAHWKKRIYRAVWDRIRQFWREDKWIRVTDDEDNLKFVGLNQPVTLAEQRVSQQTGLSPEQVRRDFADELQQLYQLQPEMQQIVEIENEVAEIDVDIIIEEVPDVVNLQSEQFDLLVKMYQANPNGIDWEDVVAMSTLRNKDKILNKELEPEEQQVVEERQAEEEEITNIAKAKEVAEIEASNASTRKDLADAENQELENVAIKTGIADLLEFVDAQR